MPFDKCEGGVKGIVILDAASSTSCFAEKWATRPDDPLLQERLKAQDQVLDVINQLSKRWEQLVTRQDIRLADRFINFEFHLLLYFIVESIDPGKLWVASFEIVRGIGVLPEPVRHQKAIVGIRE